MGKKQSKQEKRSVEELPDTVVTKYGGDINNSCLPGDDQDPYSNGDSKVPAGVRAWLQQTFGGPETDLNISLSSEDLSGSSTSKPKRKSRDTDSELTKMLYGGKSEVKKSLEQILRFTEPVAAYLEMLEDWSFDIFTVEEMSEGHALMIIGYETLSRYDLIRRYKMDKVMLVGFLSELERGYRQFDCRYHVSVHAADVTQTAHYICAHLLQAWLSDLGKLALLVACMGHDYPHTGTTNRFHTHIRSEIALIYNDKSVQENFHACSLFRLLSMNKFNILSALTSDEYRVFRRLVIEMILATDMATHWDCVKDMQARLDRGGKLDKVKMLSMVIHCCDISHPCKPWETHYRWTELSMDEYFSQGDMERTLGHSISPLCDRRTAIVSESQLSFIEFIARPTFQLLGELLEHIIISIREKAQTESAEPHRSKRSHLLGTILRKSSSLFSSSSSSKSRLDRMESREKNPGSSTAWNKLPLSQSHLRLTDQLDEIKKQELKPWESNLEQNEKNWKNCMNEGWPSEPQIAERPVIIPAWVKASGDLRFESWGPLETSRTAAIED